MATWYRDEWQSSNLMIVILLVLVYHEFYLFYYLRKINLLTHEPEYGLPTEKDLSG
jgi:hypothetical protein